MMRGLEPPSHTQAVVTLCKQDPASWPIDFETPASLLEDPLLDEDDQPTAYCRELAEHVARGNAEREACEQLMRALRDVAADHDAQDAYVAVRSYLIRNPVISQLELLVATNNPDMSMFAEHVHAMYESVPSTVVEHDHVWLCGHCGWTLRRRKGQLVCGGEACELNTEAFTKGTQRLPINLSIPLLRVRDAIRTYVTAPGRAEIYLHDALARRGLKIALWPQFDAYDLRITIRPEQVWAVDVKDWVYPHLLAPRLKRLRDTSSDLAYTKAFYVVPDMRVRHNMSYLPLLQAATRGQPFEVITVSELLQRVNKEVGRA
jgi:rubrerythrin